MKTDLYVDFLCHLKNSLVICLALLSVYCIQAMAAENDAREKALLFFNYHSGISKNNVMKSPCHSPQIKLAFAKNDCYVFNNEAGGFVIVCDATDDNDIMAYSDDGFFDAQNIPEEIVDWISAYSVASSPAKTHPAIEPMITTKWGQGLPFNLDVPSHYPAGCVSTALAQVMAYHKWPAFTTKEIGDLPLTSFNWEILRDEYSNSDNDESVIEVAKLMHYCGVSVGTNYGNLGSINWGSGSSAYFYNAAEALKFYYGYSKLARDVYRKSWSTEEWDSLIYIELANGRPVIYSATEESGHAMVCDGYDGNGGYHINWGWNGDYDGYYRLPGFNGYTKHHAAIIGIAKSEVQDDYTWKLPVSLIGEWTYHSVYKRNSDGELGVGFKVNLTNGLYDECGGLYKNHRLIETLPYRYSSKVSDTGTFIHSVRIGSHIPDGAYQLKFLYRLDGEEEWLEPLRSDGELFDLIIKDDELTVIECSDSYELAKGSDIEILGISLEGNHQANSPQIVKVSVRNTGKQRAGLFYLRIGGTSGPWIYDSSIGYAIDPGDTGDVEYVFTPEKADNYTVSISVNSRNQWSIKETFTITDENSGGIVNTIEERKNPYHIYTLDGRKTNGQRGLNIIRYSDGSVKVTLLPTSAPSGRNGK